MTNRNILAEADTLLLNHGISELPLTIRKAEQIAQLSGWIIVSYQEGESIIRACGAEEIAKKYPAFTLINEGRNIILYRSNLSYEHKLFYICHEFGHIVLKHTAEKNVLGICRDPAETARQEQEANDFATEMLAPACIMSMLGVQSAAQLGRYCLINTEQAIRHFNNIRSAMPLTETEKLLCDRMLVKHNFVPTREVKKRIGNVLKSSFAFLAGIIVCAGVIMYQSKSSVADVPEPLVTDEIIESAETSEPAAATEPETPEAASIPTQEQSQPESTSSATTPIPQITTQPPVTIPPQTTATPTATPKVTQTTDPDPQREPVIIPSSETVYITTHFGTKYHKPECYHIAGKGNLIELTIEQAKQAGYEPCKDCF